MNAPGFRPAADIIKIAMNRVYRRLKEENISGRLILQVHDELLIEVSKEDAPRAKNILKEEWSMPPRCPFLWWSTFQREKIGTTQKG